ncbi:hypothetical protein J2Z60_002188 [Lactobacillus colini]|uniref:Uncharacterized protein n=1 Tax=Lactobacillus colini TaxID=1819254 RepID=A0ABS4MH23_9LACO|nr:hypothetical protein [Lactobacillus colini]
MNLTDNEALGISLSARNELIRRSYEDFFRYDNPEAKLYPHVKVICDALQKLLMENNTFT